MQDGYLPKGEEIQTLSYAGIINRSDYLALQNKEFVLSFLSLQQVMYCKRENACFKL